MFGGTSRCEYGPEFRAAIDAAGDNFSIRPPRHGARVRGPFSGLRDPFAIDIHS